MEGRQYGFRTAANDNFPEKHRANVTEAAPKLDTVRLGALRQKVSDVLTAYPFLLSSDKVDEAVNAVSGMTRYDVIRVINKFDPNTLEDAKAHFYQALIHSLDEELVEE